MSEPMLKVKPAKSPRISPPSALTQRKTPPRIYSHSLLGSASEMQHERPQFLLRLTQQYGDVVRMRFILWRAFVVNHPDGVKHMLQENNQNYNKDVIAYKVLKPFLGKGLLTNDGQSWLHQRRLMQPTFHRKNLATFGTLITGTTTSMLESWQSLNTVDEPLNVAAEMMRLTQRIVGHAFFGIDLSNESDKVGQAITILNELLSAYIYSPFPPISVPTRRNRQMLQALQTLDKTVYDIINERRQHDSGKADLLSMLMLARDEETGQGMSDLQVRDEVLTLLSAGHETTANLLAWTWYLLSQYPEVERRLQIELDEVLGGNLPAVEHLAKLPYTRMILEETLRLYPPAWAISRKAIANDEIGGYFIPAQSIVIVSPYTTHRHPDFWENPEVFDPERFTPARSAGRPHFAYFPFGGGPRLCIGSNFAMMEAQLILATIAQRCRLQLIPGHTVEIEPLITLRPKHGLPMTVQEK